MVLFFYYYLADVILEILLVSNIIPPTTSLYKVNHIKDIFDQIIKNHSMLQRCMWGQYAPLVLS